MKRAVAVVAVLIIGMNCCPSGSVAMAAEDKEIAKDFVKLPGIGELEYAEEKDIEALPGIDIYKEAGKAFAVKGESLLKPSAAVQEKAEESVGGASVKSESDDKEESGMKNLQIPQKMAVVIDPWEMDEQGQIYSEQYVIRNTGETSGILTIFGSVCESQEQSEVNVMAEREGLHDDGAKSIYMEMEFGNGDKIVLSREKAEYQVELKPGEELPVHFAGEVNEYASDEWKDGDVTVDAVYSWKIDESSAIEDKVLTEDGLDATEKKSMPVEALDDEKDEKKTGAGEEKPIELSDEEIPDGGKQPVETPDEKIEGDGEEPPMKMPDEKVSDDEKKLPGEVSDEEEIKTIDMQMPQSLDIEADSWKTEEDGRILSERYTIRNAGETPGTIILSDFVCKSCEQSGIAVQTEKEKLHEDECKAIYMELIVEQEAEIVLPQEEQEDIRYKITLNPGEEVSVRFAGELNGIHLENLQEGDISVTVLCSWIPEEELSE